MLNQVPRTLLNMGVDGNEKHASSGSSLGWNDATDGNTDVGGGRGEAPPARVVTPHSKVFNSSREGEVAPFSAASPARRPASMSGFGANSMERRGSREGAAMGLGGRGSMSAFTNESIADQALNEFGSGEVNPYLFMRIVKVISFVWPSDNVWRFFESYRHIVFVLDFCCIICANVFCTWYFFRCELVLSGCV